MKVVLIVLMFLNGQPEGKLPEVVYEDMASCVADWKAHAKEFTPAEGKLRVMCVSADDVVQIAEDVNPKRPLRQS